jgi:hypothetical protein
MSAMILGMETPAALRSASTPNAIRVEYSDDDSLWLEATVLPVAEYRHDSPNFRTDNSIFPIAEATDIGAFPKALLQPQAVFSSVRKRGNNS